MAKKKPEPCPVCGRTFANAGGLASHRRLAKDSAHVQARAAPPKVEPEAPPAPVPTPEPEGVQEPAPKTPEPAPVEVSEPKAAPEPVQQEKEAVVVTFQPPQVVRSLAGDPQQKGKEDPNKSPEAPKPSPTGEQGSKAKEPTVSDVPLEPFIAGSVATICNGFFLDPAKGDESVSRQEVADTGFPKALELSVRKYWPDLPLDHPAVLLTISGAGLAALVKSKRAPRDEDPEGHPQQEEPEPEPVQERAPRRAPRREPEEPQVQEAPKEASPEGALWGSMLANAGQGVPDDE